MNTKKFKLFLSKIKPAIFWQGFILFGLAGFISLFLLFIFFRSKNLIFPETPQEGVLWPLIFTFFLIAFFFFFLTKRIQNRLFFNFLFYFTLAAGVFYFFGFFLSFALSGLFTLIFVSLRFFWPKVFLHNLVLFLAIIGLALNLGLILSWYEAFIFALILSFYDLISVYQTGQMVTTFKHFLEKGAIFAFVLPNQWSKQLSFLNSPQPNQNFFFLGTGDLAIPLILITSFFLFKPILGFGAYLGSLLGFYFMSQIFAIMEEKPMAALPPLVFGTLLGAFIFFFL